MKKLFSLAAAALLVGSLTSAAAFAADAPKAAPKKAKAHHMMSCNDYAYESQAMKDCMAKGDMKSMKTSATKKAPTAKKKAM
ncbi:MAG: hypothetical protein JWL84_4427 [Rhodospirillales bacterium]|nr:hypothetical protein [Rhodospirillales bacterium]